MTATATKSVSSGSAAVRTAGGVGFGKRQSRSARGLPPLTAAQTIAKQQVQGAQNACKFIKDHIENGNMPTGAVLQACSVLSGTLGGMLGED